MIRELTTLLAQTPHTDQAPARMLAAACDAAPDRREALHRALLVARNRRDLDSPEELGDPVVWSFLVSVLAKGVEDARNRAATVSPAVGQLVAWFSGARIGYARTAWSRREAELDTVLRHIGANLLSPDRSPRFEVADVEAITEEAADLTRYLLALPKRFILGTAERADSRRVLLTRAGRVKSLVALAHGQLDAVTLEGQRLRMRSEARNGSVVLTLQNVSAVEIPISEERFADLVASLDDETVRLWAELLTRLGDGHAPPEAWHDDQDA